MKLKSEKQSHSFNCKIELNVDMYMDKYILYVFTTQSKRAVPYIIKLINIYV